MRRVSVGILVPLLLLAMAVALWQYVDREPSAPELRITDLDGLVELAHGDARAVPAVAGVVLSTEDRLRTGADGRVSLQLGSDTTLSVGPTSSLQITAVDPTGVSLELENGALSATVRPESGAVRVANGGRAVVATHAVFDVGVRDAVLQVAVASGDVALSGADTTRVGAGQQAWVVDRHGEVSQIPEELLLAVQWPTEARTRSEHGTVEGRTTPGSRVRIRGEAGEVEVGTDASGTFRASLVLVEGENRVVVEAIDALGRRTEVPGVLVRDTRGPRFQAGVDYGRP